MVLMFNPKRAGGGGGGRNPPPPLDISRDNFFFRAASFHDFFSLKSCATFGAIFRKNRAYGSKVTQHYIIDPLAQKFDFFFFFFWICVQNVWKMAFCAKTPF